MASETVGHFVQTHLCKGPVYHSIYYMHCVVGHVLLGPGTEKATLRGSCLSEGTVLVTQD